LQRVTAALAVTAAPGCFRSDDQDEFEVCIVGSGPAGAVLALELARRGIRTLLVEGGEFDTDRDDSAREPLTFEIGEREPVRYSIKRTRFLGIGGTSNLWTARCPRYQPRDFDAANSYLPRDAQWPFSYDGIEKYYARAERSLDVRGGRNSSVSPPRTAELPRDTGRDAPCLNALMSAAGCAIETVPVSYASRMATTHVPQFSSEPSGRLLSSVRVIGILTGPNGEVTGLSARSGDGNLTLRARQYVLACGGIEAPRLMLGSRTREFPAGIGNASDQVGRNFVENIWMDLGTIRLAPQRTCAAEEAISWQYFEELKEQGLGGAILEIAYEPSDSSIRLSAVIEMKAVPTNRVSLSASSTDAFGFPAAQLTLRVSDDERATSAHVKAIGRRLARALRSSVYQERTEFDWCHHHMGSCRMGTDPRSSVVDENLRVHGTENLYVAGSASFVTGGVGSPTLLLTALALRLADHLVEKLGGGGNRPAAGETRP
jgi:choline dehydrogenase-like flavoprotein